MPRTPNANKKLEFKNLTLIDAANVPEVTARSSPYREVLLNIPEGKAVIITDDIGNIDTIRAGIKRLLRKPEFKHFEIKQLRESDGSRKLYIINPNRHGKGVVEIS